MNTRDRLRWLNPLDSSGGIRLIHVLVAVVLMLIIGLGIGYEVGRHSGTTEAQQLAQRWNTVIDHENIAVPPRLAVSASTQYSPPAQPANHVPWNTVELPGNQGYIGQCQCVTFRRLYDAMMFQATGKHAYLSCRMEYALTQQPPGSDNGSFFDQYVALVASVGWVPSKLYRYHGLPQHVDTVIPQPVLDAAQPHRYTVNVNLISGNPGGMNAVYGVADTIDHGYQVNFDAPVYEGPGANSYFDVGGNNGCVDLPTGSGFSLSGGHATSFYGYVFNAPPTDCTGCYLNGENQWGRDWGTNRDGKPDSAKKTGYYKVSCRFVGQYGWDLAYITQTSIKPTASKRAPWYQSSPTAHKLYEPPKQWRLHPIPAGQPLPKVAQASWWVRRALARDNKSIDLAHLADHWGKVYHVRPAGLLATIYAECTGLTDDPWHPFHQPCDRYNGSVDTSHGSCQATDQTAIAYRAFLHTDYDVKKYEDNANNCVHLMAQLFSVITGIEQRAGCPIHFPQLAVAWNAGPYNPCWFLVNPSGQAYTNHVAWLGWWNMVNSEHAARRNPYAGKRAAGHALAPMSYDPHPGPRVVWPIVGALGNG